MPGQIKAISLAKLQAIVCAFTGLLAGILYSFGGAVYDATTVGLNSGTALAFLALVGMPVMFAAAGFVIGFVEAHLYNLICFWLGGINMGFDV